MVESLGYLVILETLGTCIRNAAVRTDLEWLVNVKSQLLNQLVSTEVHVVFSLLIVLLRYSLEFRLKVLTQSAWNKAVHEFLIRLHPSSDPSRASGE